MDAPHNITHIPIQPSHAPAPRHSIQEWEAQKSRIEQLYVNEGRSLNDIMATLELESGFKASAKQYKTRLRKWGFDVKNVKRDVMLQLARTRAKRKMLDNKESAFQVAKKPVAEQKINRYLKRNGIDEEQLLVMENPARAPSPAFSVYTPGPIPSSPQASIDSWQLTQPHPEARTVGLMSVPDTIGFSTVFARSSPWPLRIAMPSLNLAQCQTWVIFESDGRIDCSSTPEHKEHDGCPYLLLSAAHKGPTSVFKNLCDSLLRYWPPGLLGETCPALMHAILAISTFNMPKNDDSRFLGLWHYSKSVHYLGRMLIELSNSSDWEKIKSAFYTSLLLAIIGLSRNDDGIASFRKHLLGTKALIRVVVAEEPGTSQNVSHLLKFSESFCQSFENLANALESHTAIIPNNPRDVILKLIFSYIAAFSEMWEYFPFIGRISASDSF